MQVCRAAHLTLSHLLLHPLLRLSFLLLRSPCLPALSLSLSLSLYPSVLFLHLFPATFLSVAPRANIIPGDGDKVAVYRR